MNIRMAEKRIMLKGAGIRHFFFSLTVHVIAIIFHCGIGAET